MRRKLPLEIIENGNLDISLGYKHALSVIIDNTKYLVKFISKYSYLEPKDIVNLFKKMKKDISELRNRNIDENLLDMIIDKVIKADIAESFVEVYFYPENTAIKPTSVHILNLDRDYILTISDGAIVAVDLNLRYVTVEPRSQTSDAKWNANEIAMSYTGEIVEINEKMVEEVKSALNKLDQEHKHSAKVSV